MPELDNPYNINEDILAQLRALRNAPLLPQVTKEDTFKQQAQKTGLAALTALGFIGARMPPAAVVGPKLNLNKPNINNMQPSLDKPVNYNPTGPAAKDTQEILNFFSQSKIPIKTVKDTPGGTTYIKFESPYGPVGGKGMEQSTPTIRIPADRHIGREPTLYDVGNYFDMGTIPSKASKGNPLSTRNVSGESFGNLDTLKEALKTRTSSAPSGETWLTSPDKAPHFRNVKQVDAPQAPKEYHPSMIDDMLKNMEIPGNIPIEQLRIPQTLETAPGIPGTSKKMQERWDNIGNRANENIPSKLINNYSTDPFIEGIRKTDKGKYDLTLMEQQLRKKGIDPTGLGYFEMYVKLHPELFDGSF